jgi:hypothetical protein
MTRPLFHRLPRGATLATMATLAARTAFAVVFAAAPAVEQITPAPAQPVPPVRVEAALATAEGQENARADALEAGAITLYGTPREWRTVAGLHRRAAALRRDDPRAVDSWRMAAWAYSAARDPATARAMMERAAERAAAGGDVERAANAYVDAAFIALESGGTDRVPGLLRKTRVLLSSPVLPADRRAAVLQRISGEARLAQGWARL